MTKDLIVVHEGTPISEAARIMDEKRLKRMPVLDSEGFLKGIITTENIRSVSPSEATSLSVYEITYLLDRLTAKDAMTRNVITIKPEGLLEEAAVLMRKHRVGALVVEEEGKAVGIITESDIFDAFIELLGFTDAGTRFSVQAADIPGVLAEIGGVFRKHGANITHFANFTDRASGNAELIIRTSHNDCAAIIKELEEKGYTINSVQHYQ
ncbi:MAG: CBS and ACT domain-containing protein [Eubacteriaceae bacterium]|nr:CBS and ACT domain-containing protein [Eubacteriaceae bacterium]